MPRGDHGSNNSLTLGPRDSLIGTLTLEGDVTVNGRVEGELRVSGDVQVADGASVQASVEANNVTVNGSLVGNVNARGKLTLAGSGSLQGDVRASKLSVDDGATLNGSISMGQAPSRGHDHHSNGADPERQEAQVEEAQPEAVG